MPQEPKKRHSRQRQGKRRAAINFTVPSLVNCSNCGKKMLSHSACKKCGYYKGALVLNFKKKTKKDLPKE